MAPTITLLTDFGLSDPYVAEMKAVLLSVPSVRLVDLTHEVPPFDIQWGAFQLLRSYHHFPKGTWHLAVVDPGVGTTRHCLYVKTKHYHFVGPDNGLLLWAVNDAEQREGKMAKIFQIPIPPSVLPTFHGRDVFAPFVVQGIKGRRNKVTPIKSLQGEPFPKLGMVIGKDHYGNAVTSIPFGESGPTRMQVKGNWLESAPNYASIPVDKLAIVRGSHGFWEIAAREASAWEKLDLKKGDKVSLKPLL